MTYLLEENNPVLGNFKLGEDGLIRGDGEGDLIDGLSGPLKGLRVFRLGVLQHRAHRERLSSPNTTNSKNPFHLHFNDTLQ